MTGCGQQDAKVTRSSDGSAVSEDKKVDPICKMNVDPEKAAATFEHNGKIYYFCSEHCQEEFSKNPERYLARH